MTGQLQNMIEMEKEAKFQALFYKKKMQAAEEKVTALNKRVYVRGYRDRKCRQYAMRKRRRWEKLN